MQQPIRVLHFIASMTNGGAESFIMNQYREIDRSKVQFDFLTWRGGDQFFNKEIEALGGRIYVIRPAKEQGAIGFIKDVVKIIKADKRIKAIHAHTFYSCGLAVLAGFLSGIKIRISHSHNTKTRLNKAGLQRKAYELTMRRLILTFSTHYFACGNEAGVSLYGKRFLTSKKSKFIPNSIDIERFHPTEDSKKSALKRELGIPADVPVYTNIGRFAKAKNHPYQLKIIKALKQSGQDFRYLMIGSGDLMDEIKLSAQDMDISDKIIFTGPRQDIPGILSITDLFLLPSLHEGLPVTLIEAQAAGVFCLCADNITKQADIGLDMVKYIAITDADLPEWVEACLNYSENASIDRKLISKRLKELNFDSKSGAEYLCGIYTKAI